MSAKSIIQSLEDSELVRIFLEFVQSHLLHYQKVHKEISYKCYEATWILNVAKATGYGRTETEAYKNSLKNLLELLMEDPLYVQYFSTIVQGEICNKKMEKDLSPPPQKIQLKTQGHEPEQNDKGQYGSFNKSHYSAKPKQQIFHSKINLNRSISQKGQSQLQQAKIKMRRLQTKLTSVLQQNRILKERLQNGVERSFKKNIPEQKKKIYQVHQSNILQLIDDKFYQKSNKNLLRASDKSLASKITIPKLNLEILPNYHKKSEKCLNDMLLAAYNEKHGAEKRIF